MTQKAYANGSEYPQLEKGKLRVYSMRFCPFAQRTLLVLGHYNIPHEVVNINLKNKPDWFLSRTLFGLVPVLEKDDKLVNESTICDEYLDELYGKQGHSLLPADPYQKARMKILMEAFGSKIIPKHFRLSSSEDKAKLLEEFHNDLKTFEENLSGRYFGGDEPSMLDYHMWPFFELIPSISTLSELDVLPKDKFPKLSRWVEEMMLLPSVKCVYHNSERHAAFMRSFLTGSAEYDLGL